MNGWMNEQTNESVNLSFIGIPIWNKHLHCTYLYCRPCGLNKVGKTPKNAIYRNIFKLGAAVSTSSLIRPNAAWEWTMVYCIIPNFILIDIKKLPKPPKTAILTKFLTLGATVPIPSPSEPNLIYCSRHIVYAYVQDFIWIGIFRHPKGRKAPNSSSFSSGAP